VSVDLGVALRIRSRTEAVTSSTPESIESLTQAQAISRTTLLTGHVLGNVLQTVGAIVIVSAVGLVIGFRPTTGQFNGSSRSLCSR
jgi:ABC-2 type transport system permease protein